MARTGSSVIISAAGVAVAVLTLFAEAPDPPALSPEVIDVSSGALTLRAHLWRPSGRGPFPAVLFNHGSYTTGTSLKPSEPESIGPVFARHGYVLLWLYRQGAGLSRGQGIL